MKPHHVEDLTCRHAPTAGSEFIATTVLRAWALNFCQKKSVPVQYRPSHFIDHRSSELAAMPHRTDTEVLPANMVTNDVDDLCHDAGAAVQVPTLGSIGGHSSKSKATTTESNRRHLLRSSPFLISSPHNGEEQ